MEEITKISIIIPCYNAQKYIARCLDSVLSQSVECEIIAVNDGSSDDTLAILQKYAQKYANIKIIDQENLGVSAARNAGIAQISGEYFLQIDSDDYFEAGFLDEICRYLGAQKPDLLRFGFQSVNEKGVISREFPPEFENLSGDEAFKKFDNLACLWTIWVFAYKTKFWRKNGLNYPVGFDCGEDMATTPIAIKRAKSVSSLRAIGVNYFQNAQSMTRSKNQNQLLKNATDVLRHYDALKGENLPPNFIHKVSFSAFFSVAKWLDNEHFERYFTQFKDAHVYKTMKQPLKSVAFLCEKNCTFYKFALKCLNFVKSIKDRCT